MNTDNTSAALIASDQVANTKVYSLDGEKLGSIDTLMIDKVSGQVRYAVLEFGGFLGMGTDRYPLPWSLLKYSQNQDGYVVPLDKQQLDNAPKYDNNQTPDYSDEYGKSVYEHYGVPWYL